MGDRVRYRNASDPMIAQGDLVRMVAAQMGMPLASTFWCFLGRSIDGSSRVEVEHGRV
jgi:hypothetical protein